MKLWHCVLTGAVLLICSGVAKAPVAALALVTGDGLDSDGPGFCFKVRVLLMRSVWRHMAQAQHPPVGAWGAVPVESVLPQQRMWGACHRQPSVSFLPQWMYGQRQTHVRFSDSDSEDDSSGKLEDSLRCDLRPHTNQECA